MASRLQCQASSSESSDSKVTTCGGHPTECALETAARISCRKWTSQLWGILQTMQEDCRAATSCSTHWFAWQCRPLQSDDFNVEQLGKMGCRHELIVSADSRLWCPFFFCCTLLACHEGRRRSPSVSGIGEKTDFLTFQQNFKNIHQIKQQYKQN